MLCRIVSLEHAGLRLVGLREGVTALFAHALDLADLADGLLELFHAVILSLATERNCTLGIMWGKGK